MNDIEFKFTIYGDIPCKSNSYKIITINGHASLAKKKVLKEYERKFYLQCTYRDIFITDFFSISVDIYYQNNRKDLDGSFKILLDCLQQCRVIKNDRQCTEIKARKFIDRNNPHIDVIIKPK